MSCCWEIMKTFICWIIAPLYHWIELGLFTLWYNWLTGEKAGRRDPDTNTISKLLCREDHFYGNYSFCFFKFHLFFFFSDSSDLFHNALFFFFFFLQCSKSLIKRTNILGFICFNEYKIQSALPSLFVLFALPQPCWILYCNSVVLSMPLGVYTRPFSLPDMLLSHIQGIKEFECLPLWL